MKSALLVIDVQNIYTNPSSELYVQGSKKIVSNINSLISGFEKAKLPIILIRHTHRPDGTDAGRMWDFAGTPEDIGFLEGSLDVEFDKSLLIPKERVMLLKHRYSAFIGTDLDNLLKKMQVGRVVIAGFMANFCCDSSARDAHDMDYFVDYIADATGCPDLEKHSQSQIKAVIEETLATGIACVQSTKKFLSGFDR